MHSRRYLRAHASFTRRLPAAIAGGALTLAILPALTGALPGTRAGAARADELTASQDALRTGWDPNEPGLTPAIVQGGTFTQLFRTAVTGQVYAQPLVVNGMLIVATEDDYVYGMDPATGAVQWTTHLGSPFVIGKAPLKKLRTCTDLVPDIGVTGTPAYDPATKDVYMFGEIMAGKLPKYYLFGINPATGHIDRKTAISGHPTNDPKLRFNPQTQMERPAVLVSGGAVYGAFASHCDRRPYVGYVARVSVPRGQVTLWTDESAATGNLAGIWQSGGGVMSDRAGRFFVTSGNGVSPGPAKGSSPPGQLAESVIRLAVNSANGKMVAKDFFSPANAPSLDAADTDLGSGGPVGLPFGTSTYPHILAQAGKDGRIFLLNRDNLGGRERGPGKTDAVLAVTQPYAPEYGHPAAFGDTTTLTAANAATANDYLFYVGKTDQLRVFRFGVSSSGTPALSDVANTALTFGYSSGAPVVTSDGTATPVLWDVYALHGTGESGALIAYDISSSALGSCTSSAPCSLSPIWSFPLGTTSKFSVPATSGGRVYVGTRGDTGNPPYVYGFGVPGAGSSLVTAPTATFAPTGVNATTARQVTVTADRQVTFTGVTADTGAANSATPTKQFTAGQVTETRKGTTTAVPVTFPVTLHKGDKLHVAVTFAPSAPGGVAGSLSFTTTSTKTPSVDVPLTGKATRAGLAANPGTVTFPLAPDQGVTDVPVGIRIPQVVTITNYGTTAETVASVTPPASPFSVTGLPVPGTQIKPGRSLAVRVTYAPTAAGPVTGSFTITDADSTSITVNLSGTGTAAVTQFTVGLSGPSGATISHLAPSSSQVNFGTVKIGKTATASIHVTNSGNQPSTITATTRLATPFHAAYRIPKDLPFNAGYDLTQRVAFTPVKKGTFTAHYTLTWTDPSGTHTLTVTLTGNAV